MRIYLDACSLQRPLDDRTQPRINIEAEAVQTVLRLVESGQVELLSSDALEYEIERIPDLQRRERAKETLKLASKTLELVDDIENHAESLLELGLAAMDALHLAFASWAKTDYFCTCDDKILNKVNALTGLGTRVVSPLQLIEEVAS
jgi:predicted nucleic acid-binding protein